jgi:hypothetical protein
MSSTHYQELVQGIPGAKLVLVEGDHLFTLQDADLQILVVLEFFVVVDDMSDDLINLPKC